MRIVIGVLYTLLPECVLFVIAALCVSVAAGFGSTALLATEITAGLLLLLALILSLQFNHSRMVFALFSLGGLYMGLLWANHTHVSPLTRDSLTGALNLLIPGNLLIFGLSAERGVFSRYGAMRFALLVLELLCVIALLATHAVPINAALHVQFVHLEWLGHTPLTQPGLLLFALALLLFNDRLILVHSAELATFFFAILSAAIMLHRQDNASIALFSAAVALAFCYAVIQQSWDMAYLDELTGLPGRRALEQQLRQLAGMHVIAMLDVDHFKRFNDSYGHDVGDQVLRLVASRLQKHAGGGKPFRYGGEEFCIVYPGRATEAVAPVLENLRADIESCRFAMRNPARRIQDTNNNELAITDSASLAITVSIGLAEAPRHGNDPWTILKAADQALYAAKQSGRNRVSTYQS